MPGFAGGPRLLKGPSTWRVTKTIAPVDALSHAWNVPADGPTGRPSLILPRDEGPSAVCLALGMSQVLISLLDALSPWAVDPKQSAGHLCVLSGWSSVYASGINERRTKCKALEKVGLFFNSVY